MSTKNESEKVKSKALSQDAVISRLSDEYKLRICWAMLEWVGYERNFEFDDTTVLKVLEENGL